MRSGSQKFNGYQVSSPPLHLGGGGVHGNVVAPQRLRYAADVEAGFKRRPDGGAPVSAQTATLVLFVLFSAFGCLMTVALSYKSHAWHADTNRQMDAVIEAIDDLRAFTDVVRAELLARTKGAGRKEQERERQRDSSYADYDEELLLRLDNGDYDNGRDRFMGVDLNGNAGLPTKPDRPPVHHQQQTAAATTPAAAERRGESTAGRRRRNASIDTVKIAKNQPNSSTYERTDVESFLEDNNEENTVPTHNRRKGKKVMAALVKKKPLIETEDEESYEDPKDASHAVTVAAAHFISDSSNIKTLPHYQGNGRIKHPDGDYRDWTQYIWNGNLNNANNFQFKNGRVEISVSGLYFVYAQIYYSDQHDINGYYVMKNNEKVLGCTTTRHRETQSDSCYTGGLVYFNSKDILSIKGLDMERYIILDPIRSFFGLYEVSKTLK